MLHWSYVKTSVTKKFIFTETLLAMQLGQMFFKMTLLTSISAPEAAEGFELTN